MRAILLIYLVSAYTALLGQRTDAAFPGGNSAMLKHIERELRYPRDAAELLLQGMVYLNLDIDSTGKLTLATIGRGLYPQLDAEALRLVHTFPDWIPAMENGHPEASTLWLPISFSLRERIGLPADKCFQQYRAAILAQNGKNAIEYLHPKSKVFFDSLAHKIKYAGESEIKVLEPYEIGTILLVRYSMKRKNLKVLDGEKLFIYLVDNGIIGKSSVGDGMPIDYILKGDVAFLLFQDDYYVHLMSHQWDWLIELNLSLEPLNANIRRLAETQGVDLISFIVSSVETRIQTTLSPEVWKAPFSRR